jgi:hypothetical protein
MAEVGVGGFPDHPDPVNSCLHPACRGLEACSQRSHGPVATAYVSLSPSVCPSGGLEGHSTSLGPFTLAHLPALLFPLGAGAHGYVSQSPSVCHSGGLEGHSTSLGPLTLADLPALLFPPGAFAFFATCHITAYI